jgi:ABC-type sugar transport system substrate-binding protein
MENTMKTMFAALLVAAAIASPALAQTAQSQQHNQHSYGTYNGYPTSEWYRQDSW